GRSTPACATTRTTASTAWATRSSRTRPSARGSRPRSTRRPTASGPSTALTPSTSPPSPTASATPARRGAGPARSASASPGPTVNTGNPANPVPVDQALNTLWNWFNSNGGTNRTPRGSPTIPGLTTRIDQSLKSPNSREITFGVTKRLGNRGSMRVDGIFRKFQDFYTTRTDLSTGQVKDQFGRSFDLGFAENTNDLKRKYKGMNLQVSYRAMERLNLGGNYTLGDLSGNVEGETGPNGPVRDAFLRFPEYFH